MSTETVELKEIEKDTLRNPEIFAAYNELEKGVFAALETYSNVHRGSGHNSIVTTHLFDQVREIVLEYLGLMKNEYVVIFCTYRRANFLIAQLEPGCFKSLSSNEIGLPLGVRILAVRHKALPKGIPFQTGGGTARLVSRGWVIWAKSPDKFEAGTPAIINIIAFARALRMIQHFGINSFHGEGFEKLTATEILYHDKLEKYSGLELLNELRHTLIGRGLRVPTLQGTRTFINMDNGASTPTFMPIWDAVCKAWRQSGQVRQEIIKEVKVICSELLHAPLKDYDVIFTSNTTEAINLTAESLQKEFGHSDEAVVINTYLEHNSNELPWRMVPGFSLVRLQVDAEGFLDLKALEMLLWEYNHECKNGKKRIKLVTVSGASNVLGTFNDLEEISRIVHLYGARLMVDAAQLVAHHKVDVGRCRIDYLAFSAHKVYAPFGSGVLIARKGFLSFNTSELELIQSSGEENIAGITALGKALVLLQWIGLDLIREEEQALTRQIIVGLKQIPGLVMYGMKDQNSPRFAQKGGVVVFNLKGTMPDQLAKKLAERSGIGVRYGCHCTHLLIKRLLNIPPLLERFQGLIVTLFPRLELPGLTRVSLGIENTAEEVDTLVHELGKMTRYRLKAGDGLHKSMNEGKSIISRPDFRQQMDDFVKSAVKKVYG